MAPSPSVTSLLQALDRVSPRARQALALRFLENRSREHCADYFGIGVEAFDMMLLRAAEAFSNQYSADRQNLESRSGAERPSSRSFEVRRDWDAERAAAAALASSLEQGQTGAKRRGVEGPPPGGETLAASLLPNARGETSPAAAATRSSLRSAGEPPDASATHLLKEVLETLAHHAHAMKESLAARDLAEQHSPTRRREDLLRLLLAIAVVGLSAYFYLRAPRRQPATPRPGTPMRGSPRP